MNLIDVFSEWNPRQMPNGQIRMQCPFRDKHTDGSGEYSFFASPDIGAYHCFSCGSKGNLVKLLTTRFGVNYFDAVEMSAIASVEDRPRKKSFESDIVWDLTPPKTFLDRGYTPETLRHFRLGTCEDFTVIPFYWGSELRGYQKRWEHPDRIVINSPGFNKKEYLYNYDDSYAYTVVVEGYSDVMRLFQHKYNATSVLGADVSKWQAEQLAKFERIYLAFDNDIAGLRATELCYHQLKHLTEVYLIPYPTKDPGECSLSEWKTAFRNRTDYAEYSTQMAIHLESYLDMKEEVMETLKRRR